MKLTTILLIIAFVLVSSTGWGQITLKEKNSPLEKVLADIEKQTKYVFLFDPDEVKTGPISIELKNATLQETLDQCFRGQPVEFTVVGNNVLLKKKLPRNAKPDADIRIHGTVVDSAGQPLPGVTVFNKREKRGTETDSSGVFSLPGAKGDVFRFSFIGFKDREITIGDYPSIEVSLEINPVSTGQVVVIGYGSSKRRDLTGAVSVVDVQDMGEVPYNTFDNALAGKAAGVDVIKTDGTPGGMARIRIRGTSSLLGGNDPLYVIDGIPVQVRNNFIDPGYSLSSPAANLGLAAGGSGAALAEPFVNGLNSLGALDPDNIASITVLKDASSTAIYGSKASNGVVIITTKTGTANTLPRIAVNYRSTFASPYKLPKLLNASQYKSLLTEAALNAFTEDTAQGLPIGLDVNPVTYSVLDSQAYFGTANTNWIKNVTRSTVSQNIGLSVSGGGQASKYFASLAYNKTPGVVDGTDFQRISGKLSLETQVLSKLRFVTNLLVGSTNQDIGDGAYAQALLARPDWAPRDATGNYTDFTYQGAGYGTEGFLNPVALLTATNNGKTLSLLGSVSGIYAICNDLRLRSTVSVNMQNYNQRNYLPSYVDLALFGGTGPNPGGVGSNANSRFADWFLENTLTYTKQFNKHSFNAVIGQSYETTKYSYFLATATGYPNNTTLTGLSSATTPVIVAGEDPTSPQSYLLSFYARANYSYLDKYLVTFTGRADGSSKFGPDNKYGYFPSGALAWRISRENFLQNARWINDLKLRGSYGLTGNQNIGDQMYRTLYSPFAYAGSSALVPTQLGNEGIRWESTKEGDLGLDLSLFGDRVNATFDYYNRQTNDALLSLPVAASSSYPSLLENAVGLRNRGVEVSIVGNIIRGGDLSWSASINVAWNSSLVTRLDPNADLSQIISPSGFEYVADSANLYAGNTAIIQGKPLGLITGQFITGIIKTKAQLDAYNGQLGTYIYPAYEIGDPMYKPIVEKYPQGSAIGANGAIIGNGPAKYFGGMTQELSYKRFGIQCFFTFSHGGHLLWVEHVASDEFDGTANADRSMFNRYSPANPNSNEPRLSLNSLYYASNLDVFSSSYFKLRCLVFHYNLDQKGWMKRAALTGTQVFMSATNVFTLTKYPGTDPETSDDPYSVAGGYIDAGNYPATRTFSVGLKTAF